MNDSSNRFLAAVVVFICLFFIPSTSFAANTGVSFTGTNERFIMPASMPALGSIFTVETCFRWDGKVSSQYEAFINRQQWGTQEWGMFLNTDNRQIGATVTYDGKHASSQSVWLGENASSVIEQGQWNHVALVGTGIGGELRFYLNGKLIDSSSQTGTPLLLSAEKPQVTAGGLHQGATAEPFHGVVDEYRISSIARYSGQTYAVPTAPFVSDIYTVGLWHFDEGTGQSAQDSSGHGYHGVMYGQDTAMTAHWVGGYPFSIGSTPTQTYAPWDYTKDGTITPADIDLFLPMFTSIFDYSQIIKHFGE